LETGAPNPSHFGFIRPHEGAVRPTLYLDDASVPPNTDRTGIVELLKKKIGEGLEETVAALNAKKQLSLPALAAACRKGQAALSKEFGIPSSQSERLAAAGPELPMLIEELDLPDLIEDRTQCRSR
jgi:hypothetical protein